MKRIMSILAVLPLFACSAGEGAGATEGVDSVEQALGGWIGPVSEESWKSSATCGSADTGITQARCAGSYCDDISLFCTTSLPGGTTRPWPNFYQEDWISEEAPGYRVCDEDNNGVIDGVVSGISASGRYADSVSLQCQRLAAPLGSRYCTWTGWFSEEQGLLDFGGMFAVGVGCAGSYCDSMRYYVCQF